MLKLITILLALFSFSQISCAEYSGWDRGTTSGGGTSIVSSDTGILYSVGANNPVTTDIANLYYDYTNHVLHSSSFSAAATSVPQLDLYPSLSGDTHWIVGLNGNGDGVSNDSVGIYEGTTLGSSGRLTIAPGGVVTIPSMTSTTGTVTTLTSTTISTGTLTSTGNVGIGSATPGQVLDVTGTVRATAFIGIYQPRTVTTTSSATPSINSDVTDIYTITAQGVALTSLSITGSPVNGQKLIIRIKDDGTARALTLSGLTARGVALPTTTVLGKYLYLGAIRNSTASTWDLVAAAQE